MEAGKCRGRQLPQSLHASYILPSFQSAISPERVYRAVGVSSSRLQDRYKQGYNRGATECRQDPVGRKRGRGWPGWYIEGSCGGVVEVTCANGGTARRRYTGA